MYISWIGIAKSLVFVQWDCLLLIWWSGLCCLCTHLRVQIQPWCNGVFCPSMPIEMAPAYTKAQFAPICCDYSVIMFSVSKISTEAQTILPWPVKVGEGGAQWYHPSSGPCRGLSTWCEFCTGGGSKDRAVCGRNEWVLLGKCISSPILSCHH